MNGLSDEQNKYLKQGETIIWSGYPEANAHFTAYDAFAIPASLLLLFSFANSLSITDLNIIDVIFLVLFFYLAIGRFFYKYYNKKVTMYLITNERIIIFDKARKRIIQEQNLKSISLLGKKINKNGLGRIEFGKLSLTQLTGGNSGMDYLAFTKVSRFMRKQTSYFDAGADQWIPVFYDIRDAEFVYELVRKQINQL